MFKCELNVVRNAIKSHSLTLESSFCLFIVFNECLSKARSVPGSVLVLERECKQKVLATVELHSRAEGRLETVRNNHCLW